MNDNTQKLKDFGYREIGMAGDLLRAYADNPHVFSGSLEAVEFNPNSANVFLISEDYEVAMMNGDTLEQFYSCPECGAEGFKEDIHDGDTPDTLNSECVRYLKDIGIDDVRTHEPEDPEEQEGE